jgi:glycosyltransferase involved in cell wall biosynthesis
MTDRARPGIPDQAPELSVVVPVYNEEAVLPAFHARLVAVLGELEEGGLACEVVYVNDGSKDRSLDVLRGLIATDPRLAVIDLSRNFGKEVALTAGLDHVRGQATVLIDADLQDPPEVIPELLAKLGQGFDVVYARRAARQGESLVKRASARAFYRVFSRLSELPVPRDVGDFRILSRRAVDALNTLRERHRFMKGLFAWIGYPQAELRYERQARADGRTKWSYWKLWNFALEGITSFSTLPLRWATYIGFGVAVASLVFGLGVVFKKLVFGEPVAGYASMMAAILFLGGMQILFLGIIGEYLGRIFGETKRRPLYFVKGLHRHSPPPGPRPDPDA